MHALPPVRVLVVDDHPALQNGLRAVLDAHPGFVALGAAADETEMWPQLQATAADLVLMDYHLPHTDGLTLCRRLKERVPAPWVVICSAYADSQLVLPAMLAGADGLVHKAAPASDLTAVLLRVARGERILPPLPPESLEEALGRLDPKAVGLARAMVGGATVSEAAASAGLSTAEAGEAIESVLEALRLDVPYARAPS